MLPLLVQNWSNLTSHASKCLAWQYFLRLSIKLQSRDIQGFIPVSQRMLKYIFWIVYLCPIRDAQPMMCSPSSSFVTRNPGAHFMGCVIQPLQISKYHCLACSRWIKCVYSSYRCENICDPYEFMFLIFFLSFPLKTILKNPLRFFQGKFWLPLQSTSYCSILQFHRIQSFA